jgi:hypothetical protein
MLVFQIRHGYRRVWLLLLISLAYEVFQVAISCEGSYKHRKDMRQMWKIKAE